MRSRFQFLRLAIGIMVGGLFSTAVAAVGAPSPTALHTGAVYDTTTPDDTLLQVPGVGESLILVVAGQYFTQLEAEQAAAAAQFGDLQGYYVESTNNLSALSGYYVHAAPQSAAISCAVEESRADYAGACEPESTGNVRVLLPVKLVRYEPIYLAFCNNPGVDCPDELWNKEAASTFELVGSQLRLPQDRWVLVSAFRTKAGSGTVSRDEPRRRNGAAVDRTGSEAWR